MIFSNLDTSNIAKHSDISFEIRVCIILRNELSLYYKRSKGNVRSLRGHYVDDQVCILHSKYFKCLSYVGT
jgi:hypothetical protein